MLRPTSHLDGVQRDPATTTGKVIPRSLRLLSRSDSRALVATAGQIAAPASCHTSPPSQWRPRDL